MTIAERAPQHARSASVQKTAVLYRMVMDDHLCPFGLKSKHLLESNGFTVEDNHLASREATDAVKREHGVKTTPQIFIDGHRIGGHDDLRRHLGLAVKRGGETTYAPVIAIFAVAALMATALASNVFPRFSLVGWLEWFVAFSMCILAVQKLQDVEGFANGFLGYDLLAQRYVPYARVYPFAEAFVGVGMIALLGSSSPLAWPVALTALFIGTVGSVSVSVFIRIPMATIIRFSVSEIAPSGTSEPPPTQAHFSSRLSR